MKHVFAVILFVCLSGCACIAKSAENIYTGLISDAHAHLASRIEGVAPSDIIELYRRADVFRAALFVNVKKLRELRPLFPEKFIFFTDPYKGKRSNYRLARGRLRKIPEMLDSGMISGVGEFYASLSSAPFNRMGIEIDLTEPAQEKFLSTLNEKTAVLHIHDEKISESTQKIFGKYPGIKFILSHCGYQQPARLRGLLRKHSNLFADLSLISNNHFGPFKFSPLISIRPSTDWKQLLIKFSTRFLVGSDIGANWNRMQLLPEIIYDFRRLLGNLPIQTAEQIAYKNFDRLFLTE